MNPSMTFNNCVVKFVKTHSDAQLPTRNHDSIVNYGVDGVTPISGIFGTCDSGYDVYACEDTLVPAKGSAEVETGITLGYITPGYWIRIEGRSGLGFKHSLFPHQGIIDNPYRGRMSIKIYNNGNVDYTFKRGDRIAQLVVYPVIDYSVEWTDKVESTHRGEKNLGSSGK